MHTIGRKKYCCAIFLAIYIFFGNLSNAYAAGLDGYTVNPGQNGQGGLQNNMQNGLQTNMQSGLQNSVQNGTQSGTGGLNGYTINGANPGMTQQSGGNSTLNGWNTGITQQTVGYPTQNGGSAGTWQQNGQNSAAMPSLSMEFYPINGSASQAHAAGDNGTLNSAVIFNGAPAGQNGNTQTGTSNMALAGGNTAGGGSTSGFQTGNGMMNGLPTGNGMMSGLPTGSGMTNGLPTGNGMMNGLPTGSGLTNGLPTGDELTNGLTANGGLMTNTLTGVFGNTLNSGEHLITWTDPRIRVIDGDVTVGSGITAIEGKTYTAVINAETADHIIFTAECDVYEAIEGQEEPGRKHEHLICTPSGEKAYTFTVPANLYSNVVVTAIISEGYPIWIDGRQVTDDNGVNHQIPAGEGYIAYDPAGNTLYIVNAAVSGGIKSECTKALNIVLQGQNSVTGELNETKGTDGYGISSTAPLTITAFGSGASLIASGAAGVSESCGIRTTNAAVTISQGATVTAAGGTGSNLSVGLNTGNGNVKVSGKLTATGGAAAKSCGIICGALAVSTSSSSTGATVSAHGADALNCTESYGAHVYGSISVDFMSDLTATGGSSAGKSYGVYAQGDFGCNGTVTCTAGSCVSDSTALYSGGRVSSSGSLTCQAGAAASGCSRGICAQRGNITGGETAATGLSASTASTGIACMDVNISGGKVAAEGATGAFAVKPAYGQNYLPIVMISDFSSSTVSADASLPQTYTHRYVLITQGSAPSPTPSTSPVKIPVSAIIFDQQSVSLNTKYGVRTVKYWYFPLNATETELSFGCTDETGKVITVKVDPYAREMYITAIGNGNATICAAAPSGAIAYCTATVSGIGTGDRSYCIEYMDNSGTWYSDWSDTFRAICTGPVGELSSVSIDGVTVPQYTGDRLNYTVNASGGKTEITFTKAMMKILGRGRHQLALNYTTVGAVTKNFYIQAVTDPPRTGDEPVAAYCVAAVLSAVLAVAAAGKGLLFAGKAGERLTARENGERPRQKRPEDSQR